MAAGGLAGSPDGARLALSDGDVWVMNADGTGKHRVAGTGLEDVDPAWSPDVERIAFVSWAWPGGD